MHNYLEANEDVPWDDLQYNFGEIMYGGHITDYWDRRITNTYLKVRPSPELLHSLWPCSLWLHLLWPCLLRPCPP